MELAQQVLSGLAQGCVYGLIALGFVLIYKATEAVNFAQGEMLMLGAFGCLALMRFAGLPFAVAAVLAVAGMGALGALVERVALRPLLGQPQFAVVMLTIGLGYVARGLVSMIPDIGPETNALDTPYKGLALRAFGLVVSADHLAIVATTLALCASLYLLFKYTRIGVAMQAASQNQLAAHYMGIPVKRLNGLAWALSGAVAGCAGILIAPIVFVHMNMGNIGLKAFPAAVVGGFGSMPGAIVGGVVVGVVESLAGFYLPEGFKDIAAYVVLLAMLVVKPTGLFGETLRKKV
jgi:branched-chain amino acid transport system permease protein